MEKLLAYGCCNLNQPWVQPHHGKTFVCTSISIVPLDCAEVSAYQLDSFAPTQWTRGTLTVRQ